MSDISPANGPPPTSPVRPTRESGGHASSAEPPHTHLGPKQDETTRRERFDPQELAIVLSHYDIGVIESIKDYPRGSRRAPKARIKTEHEEFLLKRRASGREDPYRVAFAHRLQLQLAEHNFPVARLIGTRDDNNSMVQYGGNVYELFEYVRGSFFSGSNRASQYAGFTLARLHRLVGGHEIVYSPPQGSYHGAPGLHSNIAAIPKAVTTVDVDAVEAEILSVCSFLREAYDEACARVDELGYPRWRPGIIHGDWHPGNLLFDDGHRVKAVIDFDSARLEPRIADIANGALQFSMVIGAPEKPLTWPDALAVERIRAFVRGYDQGAVDKLSLEEHQAFPWLILEALIAETVVPIAATGSFARIPGAPFLEMVSRKVKWLQPRATKLVEFIRDS